jgi:hypothetical protein|tara:strand:+ start:396 stop:983 length:588 start_codon:yes stop_codon:yes gene_type:complete
MKTNVIIVDDFYGIDPMIPRQFALDQEFTEYGNYPGQRTPSFHYDDLRNCIQGIVQHAGGNITQFEDIQYNAAYQYTTKKDSSWIHTDQNTMWAGICYLTPDAPLNSGTAIYKHKATGLTQTAYKDDGSYDSETMDKIYKDSRDMSKWDVVDMISNKFNRLVLYRGNLFHSSMKYFGKDKNTGRLFQTFFFNTEY